MFTKCEHPTLGKTFHANIPYISLEIVDKTINIDPILFCNRDGILGIVIGARDNLYQMLTKNAKLKIKMTGK